MAQWQLAELNVARAVADVDGPVLAEFVAALEAINALADAAPGFVWRLAGADAGAPAAADAVDPRLLHQRAGNGRGPSLGRSLFPKGDLR